ncbi:trehalose 6-phosphate phosphatase [Blastomonas aquatica]|uniref:Trehalose 6-phosphate phosphatase n=2 Tax=Blastomonas aquatica TaxID=1510276 RepID=A0ABQ1J0H1_9SPHN|nr:trehalose 6-phosphate phosphatase [Blastomonas aquatica]
MRTALLIDFDGTLVDIRSTPDAVKVGPELVDVITGVSRRLDGRVAIVSGRSLAQLEDLWPGAMPDMVIAGSHGQELKVEGAVDGPVHTDLFTRLASLATAQFGDTAGVVIEEKTFGLAVHYRLGTHHKRRVAAWTSTMAEECDLLVQQGDMVFELRPRGSDKGDAVRAIMALDRFQGSTPIFIGDDLTDIPAFHAVQALGGTAISVGPRTADHSDEQLTDVASVLTRIGEIAA